MHAIVGAPGTRLEQLLDDGLRSLARFRPIVGSFDRVVHAVSGPEEVLAAAGVGLPPGVGRAEALAVRLRRSGVPLEWGDPHPVRSVAELLRLRRERGGSSLDVARADPSLLTELELGAWFEAGWRGRALRRLPRPASVAADASRATLRLAADLAFWQGARAAASRTEWSRLTRSSYSALVYHRLAGESKPGQERIDLDPRVFDRQLRLLHRLGFRHLRAEELLRFHHEAGAVLPRRSFVVTLDDAISDCVAPLIRHGSIGIELFVPTAEVGGHAHWLAGEQVMSWADLEAVAAAGVAVGSHACHHQTLRGLEPAALAAELKGAREDLQQRLASALDIVAYPNGEHDHAVLNAAAAAGYRAGFTTEKGRNGAGTNPYCLRRVSVHAADGRAAVLWKVLTAEPLPPAWLRLRRLVAGGRHASAALPERAARELVWRVLVPALRERARRRLRLLEPGGVTVVTVNWNSAAYLEVLLRLVRRRSPAGIRITVVDNGSRDASRRLLANESDVRVVEMPFNTGHDVALDVGFLLAETEFVVALDVDAFPLHDGWLEQLLAPLARGSEISGARLNREYVHPCCLAMRTARFVGKGHSFRSHYRPRSGDRDASGDLAEEMSARERGRLFFFEPTSQRGPGDVGTVFGDLVYHNFYATRFRATTETVLDADVSAEDPAAAWREALERYGS